jgi:hypothetical protein
MSDLVESQRLSLVLLLAMVFVSCGAFAQDNDNLAFDPGSAPLPGISGDASLLPNGLTLPDPDSFDCPDNPALHYDGCAGARQLADGSFYMGNFADDLAAGVGRLREPDGTTYMGEFENGRRHGFGRLFDRDGNELYAGQWRDGLPDDEHGAYAKEHGLRNLIRALQSELNRNGCEAGPVDGIVGPNTRSATTTALDARPELLLPGDPFDDLQHVYRLWQELKVAGSAACT